MNSALSMIKMVPLCALALILVYIIAAEAGLASDLDGNWTVNSLPWPPSSDGETQLTCMLRTYHAAVRP